MDKPSDIKPQLPKAQNIDQVSDQNEGMAQNPNPRANENINTENQNPGRTHGAGSEITDGKQDNNFYMKEQNENKKAQQEETEIYLTGDSRLQTPDEDRKDSANDQVKNDRMEPSNDDLHETSSERLAGIDRNGSDPSASSLEEE